MPQIEKGIPTPLPAKTGDQRHKARSPWPEFLQKLVPGDSFVLEFPASTNVMMIAKWMSIPLVRNTLDNQPGAPLLARQLNAKKLLEIKFCC